MELTLFVDTGAESGRALKRLEAAGFEPRVTLMLDPTFVGPQLQVGPSSNNRVRGLASIEAWIGKQCKKAVSPW